ncbi:hypothetical protein MMC16_000369 [Acarospora aff. strigata]|nr:hypothetical protein [Acarospora aff. strigata]
MLLHYLSLFTLLLHTTLHSSPARADTLTRATCGCTDGKLTYQGYNLFYHSNRLQGTFEVGKMMTETDRHKYDEACWKIAGNHEFCYDRNLWGKDRVKLDKGKKKSLPDDGRHQYGVSDCTEPCRRWFKAESHCNETEGYWRHEGDNDVWKEFIRPLCAGKAWEFPDL